MGDFYAAMGPVLAANLLTVAFVYAMVQFSRREKNGTDKERGSIVYLLAVVMVFGFLGLSLLG